MKIILCVKQVPDTSDIKWTENNTIQREGLESIINPYDIYALEAALYLKSEYGNVEISSLTMGPLQAETVLRKTISVGADNGILLCDKKFAGADTYATAKTLAGAIKTRFDKYDLILCGQFAIDGDTAQTGPGIANFLNIPKVTYVKNIVKYSGDTVTVIRELDDGFETVEVKLPAVICMLKSDFEPTRATINGTVRAQNAQIQKYGLDDIGLTSEDVGLKGSPTYVSKAFRAMKKNVDCEYVEDISKFSDYINQCGGKNE